MVSSSRARKSGSANYSVLDVVIFQRPLAAAREQQAKSWKLRAAMSLARTGYMPTLWQAGALPTITP
jgi:hypothetical protein